MNADNIFVFKESKYPFRKLIVNADNEESAKTKLRKLIADYNKNLDIKMVYLEFELNDKLK